jgi:hypothetical protein
MMGVIFPSVTISGAGAMKNHFSPPPATPVRGKILQNNAFGICAGCAMG